MTPDRVHAHEPTEAVREAVRRLIAEHRAGGPLVVADGERAAVVAWVTTLLVAPAARPYYFQGVARLFQPPAQAELPAPARALEIAVTGPTILTGAELANMLLSEPAVALLGDLLDDLTGEGLVPGWMLRELARLGVEYEQAMNPREPPADE